MKALTFQIKILLTVVALLVATTVTLGIVGAQLGTNFMRTRFEDRMAFLARYLALNSELGILLGDQDMLNRLAGNLLAEHDVVQVAIEDARGETLVEVGAKGEGGTAEATGEVWLRQQEEEQPFGGAPAGSALLGRVRVVYTTAGIDELLATLRTRYAMAAAGLTALGLLVLSLVARSLAAPLRSLVAATRQVAGGELDMQVDGGHLPETKELADAFNHMVVALAESRKALEATYQEMMQQKALAEVGHFAFTVAHEVKNPLGIIKGALDILRKHEVDRETKDTMIGYVEDEVLRLNRLIQDFLNFSKPRQPLFQRTELNGLLQEVVERMRLEWGDKGIRISTEIPSVDCTSNADQDLLSQALLNVIKNACEACSPAGSVLVKARTCDGNWIAEIEDDGAGIAQENMGRVTEPFFTTKSQGTGLGLALVDRVIRAHGGELHFRDNVPHGAVCELSLPCKQT